MAPGADLLIRADRLSEQPENFSLLNRASPRAGPAWRSGERSR